MRAGAGALATRPDATPVLSTRQAEQVRHVVDALQGSLGPALLSVVLHGSATTTGLRPESDIDLLATTAGPMTDEARCELLARMLQLSPRLSGAADGPRRLDLMVVVAAPHEHPASVEFVYGEWLRSSFEQGLLPRVHRSPDHTLILAQAKANSVGLFSTDAAGSLPSVSAADIGNAMVQAIPPLLDGLRGDERNVLLTLARMWYTADNGGFAPKCQAAAWAMDRMPDGERLVLDLARRAYLGQTTDDWGIRQQAVRHTIGHLQRRIAESLAQWPAAGG